MLFRSLLYRRHSARKPPSAAKARGHRPRVRGEGEVAFGDQSPSCARRPSGRQMTRNLVWCRPGHHPAEPAPRAGCPAPLTQMRRPLQKLSNLTSIKRPHPGRALSQRRQVWRGGAKHRGRPARPTGRPFSRRAQSLRLTQAGISYNDLQEYGSNLEASDPSQQPLTHDDDWLYQYGSFLCPIRITSPEWRQEGPSDASQTDAGGLAST